MEKFSLAGALHGDGAGYTLSIGWDVQMEIPANSIIPFDIVYAIHRPQLTANISPH